MTLRRIKKVLSRTEADILAGRPAHRHVRRLSRPERLALLDLVLTKKSKESINV